MGIWEMPAKFPGLDGLIHFVSTADVHYFWMLQMKLKTEDVTHLDACAIVSVLLGCFLSKIPGLNPILQVLFVAPDKRSVAGTGKKAEEIIGERIRELGERPEGFEVPSPIARGGGSPWIDRPSNDEIRDVASRVQVVVLQDWRNLFTIAPHHWDPRFAD